MDQLLLTFLEQMPTLLLFGIIAVTLFTLSKGADVLVDEAVSLSVHWRIPKAVIGATVVSLGTTLPEASVSVLAAIQGNPDLALGNAIGSIIVDTGLILGIAALIGTLPIDKQAIRRQGTVQLASGFLLALVCLPIFTGGANGLIPQWMGFVFVGLLIAYIFISIKWARGTQAELETLAEEKSPLWLQVLKLVLGIATIIISSKILIPSVEITAVRLGIPQSIIAATLVAFGTSLPELVTAITAVRKGHGELAIGNIMGADILNVLFVIGLSASATVTGLKVPAEFYHLQIPAMLIILGTFRFFATRKGLTISKSEGAVLLGMYLVYLAMNYFLI